MDGFIKGVLFGLVAIGVVALICLPIVLAALCNVFWLALYLIFIPVLIGLCVWAEECLW
jgi:hypothetical protein